MDVSVLDELVHEYCVYRGIVDSGLASHPGECFSFHLCFSVFWDIVFHIVGG